MFVPFYNAGLVEVHDGSFYVNGGLTQISGETRIGIGGSIWSSEAA